jgi:hypothetical protein
MRLEDHFSLFLELDASKRELPASLRLSSRVDKATRSIGLASSHVAMQNGEHSIVCAHTSIVAREAKLPYYIIVILSARSA